jgi:hypothetical protein
MLATPRGESRFDAIALLVTEPSDREGAEIIPPAAAPTRQRRMRQAMQSHFARFSSDFLPKMSTHSGTSVGSWQALRRKTHIAGDAATRPRRQAKVNTRETDEADMPQNALRRSTFVLRKITEL